MRKQLYLDVKDRLKSIKDASESPLFKHFDLWNRQVEFIEQETPFQCPAIFIEFAPMSWQTLGNRVQECELTIRLHIVTEWFADTADYSPTEQQALDFLDIIDRVTYALQGFATPYMNAWMRRLSITNHDHEHHVDNIEEYVCSFRDLSAIQPLSPIQTVTLLY